MLRFLLKKLNNFHDNLLFNNKKTPLIQKIYQSLRRVPLINTYLIKK